MSKSVFISSTLDDLKNYRKPVDMAIRRLELRPANMDDLGKKSGDTSRANLREVGKADFFVGIIARRYGHIPSGQERSITEQEYDEAVRLKKPRLMYLLDPDDKWFPNRTDADENLQAMMTDFRAKIGEIDDYSLFTTPDKLAAQVTADLSKLMLTQPVESVSTPRRLLNHISTGWKLIAGVLGFLALLATILVAVFPQPQINSTLQSIGLLPHPTSEFAPATNGEMLVIVAEFDKQGGQTVESRTMTDQLRASIDAAASDPQLKDLPVKVVWTAEVITNRDAAKALAERNNATIVIWGSVANSILTTHYEITPRWGQKVDTPIEQTDFKAELSLSISLLDQVTYRFENAVDQSYVTKFTLAQILLNNQEFETALKLFEDVLTLAQDLTVEVQRERGAGEAWFYVGTIYIAFKHDAVKSEQAYNQAISLNPQFADAYNNRGIVLINQGKLDEAIADFTKAIEISPQNTIAYTNRGNALSDQGKLDAAIADFAKAIEIDPQNEIVYYNRGLTLNLQGKLDAAIADFTKAIEIDPQYAKAYINRGVIRYDQGKLNEAIADYTKVIEIDPQYAKAYNNRGNAFGQQSKLVAAIADFTKAIEIDPQYVEAYYNRGTALYYQGKLDEAIADYNQAIELDPQYATAYNNRGNALADQSNLENAIADYNQAIELAPQSAEAYYNRGLVFYDQGKLDAAITDYTKAIDLNPQDADAYWELGNAYYDQENLSESLKNYRRYLELAGDNANQTAKDRVKDLESLLGTPTPAP